MIGLFVGSKNRAKMSLSYRRHYCRRRIFYVCGKYFPRCSCFNCFRVYGLEQRRQSYLTRIRTQFITKLGLRSELLLRESEERRESIRRSTFNRVEECIQWVRTRLVSLLYAYINVCILLIILIWN